MTGTTCSATQTYVDRIVETHEATGAEYITCAQLPFGAAPTGVALSGLERVCARKRDTDTEGQGRFFAAEGIVTRAEVVADEQVRHPTCRMTLDYPQDLAFFTTVLDELAPDPVPSLAADRGPAPRAPRHRGHQRGPAGGVLGPLQRPVPAGGDEPVNATVTIGERTLGDGAPVLMIAEVGVNHDGDLATALELVDAAAEAGAEAVKFQTFDSAALATPAADLAAYQRARAGEAAGQREMLEALELSDDEFRTIARPLPRARRAVPLHAV